MYTIEQLDQIIEDYFELMREANRRLLESFHFYTTEVGEPTPIEMGGMEDIFSLHYVHPTVEERIQRLDKVGKHKFYFLYMRTSLDRRLANGDDISDDEKYISIYPGENFERILNIIKRRLFAIPNKEDRAIYVRTNIKNILSEVINYREAVREEVQRFTRQFGEMANQGLINSKDIFIYDIVCTDYNEYEEYLEILRKGIDTMTRAFNIEINREYEKVDDNIASFSTKQQILLMYYLGMLEGIIDNKTKAANILSALLGKSADNLRQYLSYLETDPKKTSRKYVCKTPENLDFVEKKLRELGFEDLSEQVKKEKDKLL